MRSKIKNTLFRFFLVFCLRCTCCSSYEFSTCNSRICNRNSKKQIACNNILHFWTSHLYFSFCCWIFTVNVIMMFAMSLITNKHLLLQPTFIRQIQMRIICKKDLQIQLSHKHSQLKQQLTQLNYYMLFGEVLFCQFLAFLCL